MLAVGLTGGIASGKSTVARIIKELGHPLIDADILAREALDDPEIFNLVTGAFDCLEGGKINRKKLGAIVFSNMEAKAKLEAIIHPYVIEKMRDFIAKNKDEKLVFLDIPLLYESHLEYLCDKVLVVDISPENQIARLLERDGIDRDYALKIINSQMPLRQKAAKADYVVDNNGDLENLKVQVKKVIGKLWSC
ncbi:MAG: dephospho-CoA kinase [Erysipelotrichaceae bacterium]|nr:dephospho-CoA kinase [Erysipelotrichaceae bacterium]